MIFGDKDQMNETDMILHLMEACRLCPRECDVNRLKGKKGFCGVDAKVMVARAALHMWEEPCISGKEGSGAVFFSGCSLGCGFCQNRRISRGQSGKQITIEHLVDIFLNLQEQKANNINLVTAGQFLPQVAEALKRAKARGLHIPVVYNSSGYEKTEMLNMLDGLVDIYLPDFKYLSAELADAYSHAADYPQVAKLALQEMVRQVGSAQFEIVSGENSGRVTDELLTDVDYGDGELERMLQGVVVRHLVLPGYVEESKNVIRYLYETYGNQIYISIMNQYTPMSGIEVQYPELGRKITLREYDEVVDYAIESGVENGFIQEGETAEESFIPEFDTSGV